MPTGIPFSNQFTVDNTDDPLLQGIGGNFSINLDSKGFYTINGTSVGWQLVYPELMAINAINSVKTVIGTIISSLNSTIYQILSNTTDNIVTNFITNYVAPVMSLSTQQFIDIMNNVTDSMTQMLMNLYEARLSFPDEFTISLKFSIGGHDIDENITIPIPVEIQEVVKPATIVAQSDDWLAPRAAILRYEAGNHKAVYFSFKPSLETDTDGPCKQIMSNALRWASQAPVHPETGVIANLRIPKILIDQARLLLNLSTSVVSIQQISDTIHEDKTYSYLLNLESSHAVVVYWYGFQAQVNATLGDNQINAVKISDGNWHAAIIDIPETGTWNITIRMGEDDPLLSPMAIEVINQKSVPETTTPLLLLAIIGAGQGNFPVGMIALAAVAAIGVAVGLVIYFKKKR